MDRMDRLLSDAQRLRQRLWPLGFGVAVIVALGLLGWVGRGYLQPTLERRDIRVATVERGPFEATVTATGTVVPSHADTMSSPVTAEIREVFVALGDHVERGQALIQLDTRATALAVGNLEEQLALADAQFRSRELELADAIRQARSRRELLAIDLESREARLARFERLALDGIVSEAELLEANLDVKRARVEAIQLDAEIESLDARREAELERLRLERSILDKQRLDQARRVAESTIEATLQGIVTSLVEETGTAVVEGQALATIASEAAFSVEASVSDFYGPQLRPHQAVKVRSATSEFAGFVSRILPSADSARLLLFIELDDPAAPAFHTNLRVDVEIVTAAKSDVLQVRRGPALEGGGVRELFVIEDDRAVRKPVRLGLSESQRIEIVDGVEAGAQIIISDVSAYSSLAEIRLK